jgi:hypothetical protein
MSCDGEYSLNSALSAPKTMKPQLYLRGLSLVAVAPVSFIAAGVPHSANAQLINDSSLVLHYDASDLNADGFKDTAPSGLVRVDQWKDKSASASHATRAWGAAEGQNVFLFPSTFHGQPTVHFGTVHNGNTTNIDHLDSGTFTAEQITGPNRDEISVFMVLRRHANVVHFQWQTSNTNRVGFEGGSRWDFVNDAATNVGGNLSANFNLRGEPYIQSSIRTPASAAVNPRTQLQYFNGALDFNTRQTSLTLTAGTASQWGIGTQSTSAGSGNPAHVDFGDIAVYNRALSDAERIQVENHFKKKYFLDANSRNNGVYINRALSPVRANLAAMWGVTSVPSTTNLTGTLVGTTTAAEVVDKAFDGYDQTKYLMPSSPVTAAPTAAAPYYIYMRTAADVGLNVTGYDIISANDSPDRDLKDWTLQGSNNGSVWTDVDARTGELFATRFLKKSYICASPGTYSWYRLKITANNGNTSTNASIQLAELALMATPVYSSTFNGTTSPANPTLLERAMSAFDGRTDTKFNTSTITTPTATNPSAYVQAQLPAAEVIRAYVVASANDVPGRDPRTWTMEGSNDGTSWTVLDTQTNIAWQARYQLKEFNIPNSTAYSFYRLNISQNWGEPAVQLSEFQIFNYSATTDSDGDGAPDAREFQEFGNLSTLLAGDDDLDGLTNGWEFTHFGAISSPADGSVDSDLDGRLDSAEHTAGTNPKQPDTDGDGSSDGEEFTAGTNPLSRDSDSDGLADGEEATAATNPLAADSDGDGQSDSLEVAMGFNPNNNTTKPAHFNAIAINFVENGVDLIQPGEVTGPYGYLARNWNNVAGRSSAAPYNSSLSTVTDHQGNAVPMTVNWVSPTTFRFNNSTYVNYNTPVKRLLNGYLDDSTTDNTQHVTLTGIPYARYHVIVFTEGDNTANGNSGSYRIVDPAAPATIIAAKKYLQNTGGLDTSIVLTDGAAATGTAAPFGNALIFRDLTASAIRVVGLRDTTAMRSPIGGIMIVPFDPVVDSDSDTLADEKEIVAYQSLDNGPTSDTDGDGLDFAGELALGTNPTNRDSDSDGIADGAEVTNGTSPILADTDADGLSDLTEVQIGTNGNAADSDSDSFPDGTEIALGSDPALISSTPASELLHYDSWNNITLGAGNIATQSSTGLYAAPRTMPVSNGNVDIEEGSLAYGQLRTGGNRLAHRNLTFGTYGTSTDVLMPLDVSPTSRWANSPLGNLVSTNFIGGGAVSGTLYLSFLQRCNRVTRLANGDLDGGDAFFGFQLYRDTTEVQGFGEATGTASTAGTFETFAIGGVVPFTPTVFTDNRTHLWVVKLTFNASANDSMQVWLDPDLTKAEAQQTGPTLVKTNTGDLSFNRLAYRGRAGKTDHFIEHDEARFGTTWASVLPVVSSPLIISEFSTTGGLEDEDGSNEDWIEIYNGSATPYDLTGCYLTDTASNPMKWQFPARTLAPGAYLVVFASDKDTIKRPGYTSTSVLHTNFKLTSAGEYLGLIAPDGTTVISEFTPTFPAQQNNYSYGTTATVTGYMSPTPGTANSTAYPVAPVTLAISQDSGVFTAPFTVTVSRQSPTQQVRYTLNGSIPSISNGFTYTGPVTISGTAQFRCRVAQPGYAGPISSEQYLFVTSSAQPDPVPSYNLPVIVVDTHGRAIQQGNGNTNEWPSDCSYIIYGTPGAGGLNMQTATPSVFSRGRISVRGKTSSDEVKKGYNIEFWQEESDDDNDRSVFGLPADSDWVLYAGDSFDKNGMRNVLMYDLSRQVGRYAPNTRYVELYVNTGGGNLTNLHYAGVYVFMEKPNRHLDRVPVEEITPTDNTEPNVSGGYIFQINKLFTTPATDLRFGSGTYVPATGADFLVEYPEESDATVAQRTYLNTMVNEIEDTINANPGGAPTFTHPVTGKHYRDYIDVPSWVDHHLLNVAANNVDGLRLSGKFWKPRGGKVFAGPIWDFDRSIESNDGRDDNPSTWNGTGDGTNFFLYGWWRGNVGAGNVTHGLFKDADFAQAWVDRWVALRRTGQPLNTANLNALLDSYEQQQFPTGSTKNPALRNIAKWPTVNTPRGGTFQNETTIMRNWLTTRFTWIDGRILATPVPDVAAGPVAGPVTLTSSDLAGVAKIYYTLDGSDPRAPGGAVAGTAVEYTGPVTIPGHTVLKARLFKSDEPGFDYSNLTTRMSQWSGLLDTYYFGDATPAAAGNLAVSELMYHPADPTPAEITAGFTDSDQFEYIELLNTGTSTIDLFESYFTSGIDYHFRNGTITQLAPGERLLIVKDLAAFTFRYGTGPLARVAGVIEGNDNFNNNGETVTIVDRLGAVILSFTYDDAAPWPADADDLGRSLVLKLPETNPNHNTAANWRSSVVVGGEPAGVDSVTFNSTSGGDVDKDGLTSLVEHATGTSDTNPSSASPPVASLTTVGADKFQTLTIVRDLRADGIVIEGQRSTDLGVWDDTDIVHVLTVNNGNGTETLTFRSAIPYQGPQREYLRILVTLP